MARAAIIFGQFDQVADPINLPHFRDRLTAAGIETILITHLDSQKCVDFLRGYKGRKATVGSSLGAAAAALMAGYVNEPMDFVGGFQPSDFDPVCHPVLIKNGLDIITRAALVPANVKEALCFRNPLLAITGGLGHATYVLADANTKLTVIEREDVHPGDFPPAQDIMYDKATSILLAA